MPPKEEHKDHRTGYSTPRDESPTKTMRTTMATDGSMKVKDLDGGGAAAAGVGRLVTMSFPLVKASAWSGFLS